MLAQKAEALAKILHAKQVDKAGKPYVQHLQAVANNLIEPTDEMLAVAWLHDSIEDTSITYDELNTKFGKTVSDGVDAISKRSGENYDDYLVRVKENPTACLVKIADLKHNADLTRLPKITEKDVARQHKYQKAIQFLLS